ncbi:MAG: hypothetical protein JWL77_3504 [Chthonomonadaceae bacterium]|nr:hypothetical protein [Chthonomonadaceae bacterium]
MQNKELQYMMAAVFIIGSGFVWLTVTTITQPRNPARRISCLSNMKQAQLGVLMYQEDYDGRFPPASQWMDVTLSYVKDKNVYRCPDLHSSQPTDYGHGFNASLSLQPREKYKAPEKVIMLYDSSDLRWNANAPGRTGAANPPRHPTGDSFGFADGHAKTLKLTATDE